MAEGKKSFVLYTDIIHTVRKLSNEKAGELFKHILSYVNDEHPVTDDILIEVAFEPIKQALKKDLQKWDNKLDERSNSGKLGNLKRWHNDLYTLVVAGDMNFSEALAIANDRKASLKSHSDKSDCIATKSIANIAVNDNVNVNVNVNERDNITPTPEQQNIDHLVPIENLEQILLDDYMWIESLARLYRFDSTAEKSMQIARVWVKKWVENQRAENVKLKSKQDAFKHCKNWINIQLEKYGKTAAKDFNGANPRTIATADKHNSEKL